LNERERERDIQTDTRRDKEDPWASVETRMKRSTAVL